MVFFSAKKLWSDLWKSIGPNIFWGCRNTFELSLEEKIMFIGFIFAALCPHEVAKFCIFGDFCLKCFFLISWKKVEHHQILTFFDQKLFFRKLFRNVNYNTQSAQKWIFRCFWCVFHHKHLCEHSTTDQPKITTSQGGNNKTLWFWIGQWLNVYTGVCGEIRIKNT